MTALIGILMAFSINQSILFDFNKSPDLKNWQVVNDDVMGGRSQATLELSTQGSALFKGRVSLENNGGFSSVRYNPGNTSTKGSKTLVLRVKGDGKNYQVRIRENKNDYFSYIYTFSTHGQWETIKVPLAQMYPSFRGRKLDRPSYSGNSIMEITFLIANNEAEQFQLELQKAYLE